jgi:hypothetical protein
VWHRGVIAALLVTMGIVWASSRSPARPSYGRIRGRVYAALDRAVGPVNPISGAVISNGWDSATTTTDEGGYFQLRIQCPAEDERLTLKARSGNSEACGYARCYGDGSPGNPRSGYVYQIFFDGGRFGSQRCSDDPPPPSPPPSN